MNLTRIALLTIACLLAPATLTGCVIEEEVEEYPEYEETRGVDAYPAFEQTDFDNDGTLAGP